MVAAASSLVLMMLATLSLLVLGCGQDTDVTVVKPNLTIAGQTLLTELRGTWTLSAHTEGNCSTDHQISIPVGRTRFEMNDNQLLIMPLDGVGDDILLYPRNGDSLSAQIDVSVGGCQASLDYELTITAIDNYRFSGVFRQLLNVPDSILCSYSVPSCQHRTSVLGIRR